MLFLTNFSYVIEDRIVVPYILAMIILCCLLLIPLYRTKDKKGYFIIAGVAVICLGAAITVVLRVWKPPFSIFYLKAGIVLEVLIFSIGLAYRQRKQKQLQQQAEFKLKESQLIQEKKELETRQLKALNEFKARFYTNITHEFRTPLTVIMGMSDNLPNKFKEKQLIQRNSQNLLRLINQLLDLSKLESKSLTLKKVHQDIIVYLQYLTESFYSTAQQKNIRLVFYSERKEVQMDYDEEKIQQIVYNLLSNAIKFTPEHGKIVFHATTVKAHGHSILQLKFKDNGVGIPKIHIHAIFDRFYQIPDKNEFKQAGTGIGLALTKELVELMKGRIEVQSELGEGTEFIVQLPIESKFKQSKNVKTEVSAGNTVLPLAALNATGNSGEQGSSIKTKHSDTLPELLIIEDNPDIITYIKTILTNQYAIHTAKNGALGIDKAIEIIPDIIISDVMMSQKNGYEVCQILKQDERTSHIPIVLLTAKSTQTERVQGLKHGADAYLTKPFDKEELLIQLENLVQLRQRLQQRYANVITATNPITNATEPSIDDLFLQKLQNHIQTHLSDAKFGVTELAKSVHLSQMQLYRKLKALTDKTPSQFIRSYRLHCGLKLLKKGELNISEIAYEVGFTDPSYFSRTFLKEFGKSSSDYIK